MCQRAEVSLECDPRSVSVGRRWVAQSLLLWEVADEDPARTSLDDLTLVTSELLANAVVACYERVVLALEAHRDHVIVTVRDDSPHPASARRAHRHATGGRGLAIVASLAERWGQTDYDGATKDVWASIHIEPGSVLARKCEL